MKNHGREFEKLIEGAGPEIIEVFTALAEALMKVQKAEEAEKYAEMLISPAEAGSLFSYRRSATDEGRPESR